MAIRSLKDVVDAELEGRVRATAWVKTFSQITSQGIWFDATGSAGNPRSKQWFDATPLVAQQASAVSDGGIFAGSSVAAAGFAKYARLLRLQCASATPLPMSVIVCDYLLYYPSIDDGVTDPQICDNTLSLPRYPKGEGVRMIAVTISSRTGGQTFSVNYTNSAGVAGRVTPNVTQNAVAAPGTITTSFIASSSGGNPFIPLQGNDLGVRSVQSVTMNGADSGFFAIVLVKPLFSSVLRSVDAVYSKDLLIMSSEMPEIKDNAFLSMLLQPNGSLTGISLHGTLRTIWN